jgi:hypothetical protein
MTIDAAQLAVDEAAMIADMPIDVTFGGKTISGCKSVLADTEVAAAAGELKGYKLSVYVVTANWSTAPAVTGPAVGDLLTADSLEYRVLRLISDIVGSRYDLGEKYAPRTPPW